MKAVKLSGLEPASVFGYFEKLCSIPHGSFNTKAISDYLVSFAKEHNLRYIQDKYNNVIMFKDASAGYEDHPPVILQGHMDMICVKEPDCTINMETDPLDVTHDGTYVFARGTSLGADDGAGVALILAVLEDDTLVHPPLEAIFTSDEEPGLLGVADIDVSMLKGRRMLNLDVLNENVFTAGCAGGARVTLEMPVEKIDCSQPCVRILLDDFHGGHSGAQIHLNYANAHKCMNALLQQLRQEMSLNLVSMGGGTAANAIPPRCEAVISTDGELARIQEICDAFVVQIKQNYSETEVTASVTVAEPAAQCYSAATTDKVISLLDTLPTGVISWSPDFENVPQTSLNLSHADTQEQFFVQFNVRSSINQERDALRDQLRNIAAEYGCKYNDSGIYSGWTYRKDSPLRETMRQLYMSRYEKSPTVAILHVGLECGVLSEKLPGLDCVSTGPNSPNVHSTQEKMEIASMNRFWHFLLDLLKAL